jgi:NTE family protein
MSHIRDDKSVQEECYKISNEHNPAETAVHTNLSAPTSEPELYPEGGQTTSNIVKFMRIPPRRIALCGGGMRGVAHVGIMKALKQADLLKNIKEVIGISAGSFFALLWILDYTVEQIEKLTLEFDFTLLRNISPETVFNFPLTYGLDDGKGVEKLIASVLRQKGFSEDVTFEEVAKKHTTHFRCFATELQTSRVRVFGSTATPGASVKMAIRASMSLPIFYTPVEEPGTTALLMDGGLISNLPLVFMNDNDVFQTWCVFFLSERKEVAEPVSGLAEVIRYIYDSASKLNNLYYTKKFKERLIIVPAGEFSQLNFEESQEMRKKLIRLAYDKANEFIYLRGLRPARRYSAG